MIINIIKMKPIIFKNGSEVCICFIIRWIIMLIMLIILISYLFSNFPSTDTEEVYCDSYEGCEVFICKSDNAYELGDVDTARYFLERYEMCMEKKEEK